MAMACHGHLRPMSVWARILLACCALRLNSDRLLVSSYRENHGERGGGIAFGGGICSDADVVRPACRRLGGDEVSVSEPALLSTLLNVEFAFRKHATEPSGLKPTDMLDWNFSLLGLEGARVVTYYTRIDDVEFGFNLDDIGEFEDKFGLVNEAQSAYGDSLKGGSMMGGTSAYGDSVEGGAVMGGASDFDDQTSKQLSSGDFSGQPSVELISEYSAGLLRAQRQVYLKDGVSADENLASQMKAARQTFQKRLEGERLKSLDVKFATVLEMLGSHVIVQFDNGDTQEVPLHWLRARMSLGTQLIVRHQGLVKVVKLITAERASLARVELPSETGLGEVLHVSANEVLVDLIARPFKMRVNSSVGVGRFDGLGADSYVAVQVDTQSLNVSMTDIAGHGPEPFPHNCVELCNSLTRKLEESDIMLLDASLPLLTTEVPANKFSLGSNGKFEDVPKLTKKSFASSHHPRDFDLSSMSQKQRAQWVLAGYFDMVPTFVDFGEFPEHTGIGPHTREAAMERVREAVLEARRWLLVALDKLSDRRAGFRSRAWGRVPEALDLLGEHSKVAAGLAFEVLESAYVNSVNAIFLHDSQRPEPMCEELTLAYVKSWGTGLEISDEQGRRLVYVCPAFFSYLAADIDHDGHHRGDAVQSVVASLVHEFTHLPVASTEDVIDKACDYFGTESCYGLSACLALAKRHPAVAQRNADTYAFLVERLVLEHRYEKTHLDVA